jgi:sugar O-acyltransferase (sialic acid O-acetyltransferase NeuD family)
LKQAGYSENAFVYFDNNYKGTGANRFSDCLDERFKDYKFIVSLGYKYLSLKDAILKDLILKERELFSFIHSSSFINPTANIGKGVVVYPMCNIDQYAEIGDGVLLNNSVTVSHNCTLGSAGYYSPGVVLSGNVNVGSATFLGTGTNVSNSIHIGSNCIIGVGTVVTINIPDSTSAIGNPVKILNRPLMLK